MTKSIEPEEPTAQSREIAASNAILGGPLAVNSGGGAVNQVLPTNTPEQATAAKGVDETWLRDFYKECGREVTLAYTTLNQMKNWAITITAAIIAAIVSLAKSVGGSDSGHAVRFAIFVGASAAFVFTLRFFVRAILCYINLLRWNKLQDGVVRAFVVMEPSTQAEAIAELRSRIDNYYLAWRATISRPVQLLSNLKLGFALLLAAPLPLVVWGTVTLWADPIVRGVATLVVGVLLLEAWDFMDSSLFDDVPAAKGRKARRKRSDEVFPTPTMRWGYAAGFFVVVAVATLVAYFSPAYVPAAPSLLTPQSSIDHPVRPPARVVTSRDSQPVTPKPSSGTTIAKPAGTAAESLKKSKPSSR